MVEGRRERRSGEEKGKKNGETTMNMMMTEKKITSYTFLSFRLVAVIVHVFYRRSFKRSNEFMYYSSIL